MRFRITFLTMVLVAFCADYASAGAGTDGYEYVRSEPLQIMDIDIGNVDYDFSGSASIPFTLKGSRGSVYLVIYTTDKSFEGGWHGPGHELWNGGHAVWTKPGENIMVKIIELGALEEGSHTGTWDGTDWDGQAVAPGAYRVYAIGVNDIDDGNWIGITGWGFRMRSTQTVVYQGQGIFMGVSGRLGTEEGGPREDVKHGMGGGIMMYPIAAGNYLENDKWDLINVVDFPDFGGGVGVFPEDDDDSTPTQILNGQAHGAATDPDDFTRWWVFGYGNAGIIGLTVDEAFTTSEPMDGFGDPPNSWKPTIVVDGNSNIFDSVQFYEDGLYMGHGRGTSPPVADVYELDPATGEVTDRIDASQAFVFNSYTGEGRALQASMINNIHIDPSGFVLSAGGWGGASTSESPSKIDWDGNLIYKNSTGDGFVDIVLPAEAEALGIESTFAVSGQNQSLSGSPEGFVFANEGWRGEGGVQAEPYYGAICGPDGSGIFHVEHDKLPLKGNGATGNGVNMIHEHSAWDGLYILTNEAPVGGDTNYNQEHQGYQIAHLPFRIESAFIGEDFPTAVSETSDVTPEQFELGDNYPNPFNAQTNIDFAIPAEGLALLTVHNSQGQQVSTLVNEFLSAGSYRTTWDGNIDGGEIVAGGMYFYRLRVGEHELTKKMTLLK